MINEYEVPGFLAKKLEGIDDDLRSVSPTLTIFKSIQCLANYTKDKMKQHDLNAVKKCFKVAENLYVNGNELVKNAIENVLVFSFSSLLNMGDNEDKKKLQAMTPLCLHTSYVRQLLKSGI